ncbi:MAG: hypothetical protein AABX16_01300 [Nanoarchaeota archaeon]|mgnify:FL=1
MFSLEYIDLEEHFPEIKRFGYFIYETDKRDSEDICAGFKGGCVVRKSDLIVYDSPSSDPPNRGKKYASPETLEEACKIAYHLAEEKLDRLKKKKTAVQKQLETVVEV